MLFIAVKRQNQIIKVLIGLLILSAIVAAIFNSRQRSKFQQKGLPQEPTAAETGTGQKTIDISELPAGAIVFDMKYHGLSGKPNELRYNSYYGFGGPSGEDSCFIKALRKNIPDIKIVYNQSLKEAEWSGVEVKNDKAVALYFDLNADGKVSGNEKIAPAAESESETYKWVDFVTPDFMLKAPDGSEVPFRTLLRWRPKNSSSMWSPSCVLEGISSIDGEPTKLILFTSGFKGSFKEFGRCSFALFPNSTEKVSQHIPKDSLSTLINYKKQFYRLKIYGDNIKGKTIRVVLQKDTTPTGKVAVTLQGNAKLKSKLLQATITGSKDKNIQFDISKGQSRLPAGQYNFKRGYLCYGTENDNDWKVRFNEGPKITIAANSTYKIQLCKPAISIRAIDEKNRRRSDVKEQSVFSKGTKIYLSPKFKGKAGETYTTFSQKDPNQQSRHYVKYKDKKPEIKIVDSDGKEVLSAKMEYG
ncbi:MAG: hypothetical protein ACYSSI_02955 [Planctomycetota bacterium]